MIQDGGGLLAEPIGNLAIRERTMRNVQLVRVVAVGVLVALSLTDGLTLPVLYVAAMALGVAETFFDTAAQSILPSIVAKEQLPAANGRLYGVELVMNQFVGPPLGGLLIVVSLPLALSSSVIGYAIAALACRSSWATSSPCARVRRPG